MRLRRIAIRRLPGIPRPGFELDGFADGINVVVGPNASGKTSISRAVRAALYGGELARESVDVEAVFALGDGEDEDGRDRREDGNGPREGLIQAARTGGVLIWTRDGERIEAPALPEHRFVSCYTLHLEDLLAGDADTDADIARRLVREMAGGYDLVAARRECGFSVPPRAGRTEANEVSSAGSDLRHRQARYRDLQRDEEQLDPLERELDEAREAEREAALAEQALRLLEKRREGAGLERRMAALPSGLGRLSGDEAEALERVAGERRRAEEDLARAEADRRAAERALAATGLAGSPLDEGRAADMRPRIARLELLEGELARERDRAEEEAAARDRAARELGGEPGKGVRLGPEAVHAADQALDGIRQITAELRELDAELSRLVDVPETEPDPERIDEARRELLHWLSAPDVSGTPASRASALLVLAATGIAGAVAAGLSFHPAAYALLAPIAAALVYVFLLLRSAGIGAGRRLEAEQRYRRSGFERPESWEREQVAERLHALDRELGAARQREDDLRRRREAERKREILDAALERDRGRLAEIARRVNFDPEALDASFDRWLRLTGDYDRADLALGESRARRAALEREAGSLRADIVSFLADHGEAPGSGVPEAEAEADAGAPGPEADAAGPPAANGSITESTATGATMAETPGAARPAIEAPPAAEVLRHRLERLAGRIRGRDGAERDLRAARENLGRLSAEIEKRRAEKEEVFRGAGLEPGDEAGLRGRLELLDEWRSLNRQLTEVRVIDDDLTHRELAERPDLLREVEVEDGEASLRSCLGHLREGTARVPALSETIAGIRARVELASRGRDLEEARARRQRAGDALQRRFDEVMLAEAGAFVLDQVESEHVRTSRPAVLRRAEDWFTRFTRHEFELAMGAAGDGTFRARETATGEWRALAELSSGTRMQLLLAVRVAFAIEAEKGRAPLPLFLDEALTTADPERFRAVADSLRRLSEEGGRQIFYLTAQPEEGRYWAEAGPTVIDLGASRRAGRAVTVPEEVRLPSAAPEPPPPGGLRPEEYAVRIGALPVRPWEHPAGIHVFHFLRDDLDLLRRLLRAGVERLGPLVSLLDSGEAALFLSPDERVLLRLRIEGARAWIEAWREGRGRPVDREVLAASGAITPVFIDRLVELAGEVDGDPRLLLRAMDTGAVPRFWGRNRERLEEWFRENAYLGDAEPLDTSGLERRVAMALTAHGAPPESALDQAAELARSMAAGLAAGHKGALAVAGLAAPGETDGAEPA